MSLFTRLKKMFETQQAEADNEMDPLMLRAILLLETAIYDDDLAAEEMAAIAALLARRYGLTHVEIGELLVCAQQHREGAPDVYLFTRSLCRDMSIDERKQLMIEIWQVIFADGRVDDHEDHFARKMQSMLRLDHPTWIETKQTAKALWEKNS